MKALPVVLLLSAMLAGCKPGTTPTAEGEEVNSSVAATNSATVEAVTPPEPEAPRPVIVSRSEWGAKPPVMEMQRHTEQHITIHHTAVKQNRQRTLAQKLQGLQGFSQREDKLASGKTKPAWPDVPYHFYVAVDGQIGEGREMGFVPSTNTSYDPTGHITIVLEGNFEEEEPTLEQMNSTKALVAWLAQEHKIAADNIGGHKDYTQTACPGKNLHQRLVEFRTN